MGTEPILIYKEYLLQRYGNTWEKKQKIRERKQSEHILYQLLFWSLPILFSLRIIQQQ